MDLFGFIQAVLGYILVLFVPGYALSWALYTSRDEITFPQRMALSFVLSIASVMAAVLFADVYLGIDFTPVNIVFIILGVTAFGVILWRIRIVDAGKLRRRVKSWLFRLIDTVLKGVRKKKIPESDSGSVEDLWGDLF